MTQQLHSLKPEVYQGQFGEFTITDRDRIGVIIYRTGLIIAALCFAVGTGLILWQPTNPLVLQALTPLYFCFWLSLGVKIGRAHV